MELVDDSDSKYLSLLLCLPLIPYAMPLFLITRSLLRVAKFFFFLCLGRGRKIRVYIAATESQFRPRRRRHGCGTMRYEGAAKQQGVNRRWGSRWDGACVQGM